MQTAGTAVVAAALALSSGWVARADSDDKDTPPSAKASGKSGGAVQSPRSAAEEEYGKRLAQIPPTVEGHLELAGWCREKKLRKEERKHLEAVVLLDPDHVEARRLLGFQKVDGVWKTRDEVMRDQGYVLHKGRWVLAQQKEQEEAAEADRKRNQGLYRRLRPLVTRLRSEKEAVREGARQELLAIKEPEAVEPLLDVLAGEKSREEDRYLLVEILEKIPAGAATTGLVRVAVGDDRLRNRERAAEALKPRKSPGLLRELAGYLKDNNNAKVNRAATALGELGDDTMVVPLIEALVTTHKYKIEPSIQEVAQAASGGSRGTQKVVTPDGRVIEAPATTGSPYSAGGGFGVGPSPGPKIVTETLSNNEVLTALEKLTGQTLGFDKTRWTRWLGQDEARRNAVRKKN
jgi:hypothetical protein